MLRQKLMSRKFWVVVATFVASAVAIFYPDVAVNEEAIVGAAGVAIAYLFGQSWVDKTQVNGQLDLAKNEGLLQAQAYIKFLEAQVGELGEETPE